MCSQNKTYIRIYQGESNRAIEEARAILAETRTSKPCNDTSSMPEDRPSWDLQLPDHRNM
jgi:hypothetical protein